jgi:predicted RNA-binding Zn-ribbon protein involved in translation (DUF1610 family)
MTEAEKKAVFLDSATAASGGRYGNLEFSCPLCGGYAIGVRKSWFGSILASCSRCGYTARGETGAQKSA